MNVNNHTPSRDLYNQVRAGFIGQGSSLTKWCRNNGIKPQNAIHCLMGTWDGPKGKALRAELISESGIAAISNVA